MAKLDKDAYNQGKRDAYTEILQLMSESKEGKTVWQHLKFTEEEQQKYVKLQIDFLLQKLQKARDTYKTQAKIIGKLSQLTID